MHRFIIVVAGTTISAASVASAQLQTLEQTYTTHDGTTLRAIKRVDPLDASTGSIEYELNGRTLSAAERRSYETDNQPPVIDPRLDDAIASGEIPAGATFVVMVEPAAGTDVASIVTPIRNEYRGPLDRIRAEVAAIYRSTRPADSLSPAEERDLIDGALPTGPLSAAQRDELADLNAQADTIGTQMHAEIRQALLGATAQSIVEMEAVASGVGAEFVQGLVGSGGAILRIDLTHLPALAANAAVRRVVYTPHATPALETQKASLGLTGPGGPWAQGVTGDPWDFGILDTGVQQDHPALASHGFESVYGTEDHGLAGHGTGMAGIVASTDATYRGVAYGCDHILVGSAQNADVIAHGDWLFTGTTEDPDAVNLSVAYGLADEYDWGEFEQWFDAQMNHFGTLFAIAVGNDGNGPNTITIPSNAYNSLSVGNVWDQHTVSRDDDFQAASSGQGPTLGGRRKPDISAPGQGTSTTSHLWETQADFLGFGGTSSAAAHVTGSILIMASARGNDYSLPIKAALLNTADTWSTMGTASPNDDGSVQGSLWDPIYGWGYLDVGEAFYNASDVFIDDIDDLQPTYKFYTGYLFEDEKATLTWNRHVGYPGQQAPSDVEDLTDLDLYLFDRDVSGVIDGSWSSIDNVEQVAADENGWVVVKVQVFGDVDPDIGAEPFALATEENFVEADGPSLLLINAVSAVTQAQHFVVTTTVQNNGDLPAHLCNVSLNLPAGYTHVGPASADAGTVPAGGSVDVEFIVDAPCIPDGLTSLSTEIVSNSYGEVFNGSTITFFSPDEPLDLVENAPFDADDPQRLFGYEVVANEWHAIGVYPGATDRDLQAGPGTCPSVPYATSSQDGGVRDFIVVNGHTSALGTDYARVYNGQAGDAYRVEYDRGFDVALATTRSHTISAFDVVEPYEWELEAGQRYQFSVTVTTGAVDFAIFQFDPSQESASRAQAASVVDETGGGGNEVLDFVATENGVHAFVLVNENHNGAQFDVRLDEVCLCERDGNQVVDVLDLLAFLSDWFALDLAADIDGTADVTVLDLLDFLSCWFPASNDGVCS